MTEQVFEEHETQATLSNVRDNSNILARFKLYGTLITSRIVKNVCNIVLFLVATDLLSAIIASKVFCIWFVRIVV